eukprot:Pompholyxophrys_punicea_v1_NODE_561_length_1684_cov_33.353591.p1 type:complete len:118 gc:universal NODE_561_length_1684_cov_33.353591:998-1351(+)
MVRHLSTPGRWVDLERIFGRPREALSRIFETVLAWFYDRWGHLLDFRQISNRMLQRFAQKFVEKGSPLDNLWGLIDGTIRPIHFLWMFFLKFNKSLRCAVSLAIKENVTMEKTVCME